MFSLDLFINKYVTNRPSSMFYPDIEANKETLAQKIEGKSVRSNRRPLLWLIQMRMLWLN